MTIPLEPPVFNAERKIQRKSGKEPMATISEGDKGDEEKVEGRSLMTVDTAEGDASPFHTTHLNFPDILDCDENEANTNAGSQVMELGEEGNGNTIEVDDEEEQTKCMDTNADEQEDNFTDNSESIPAASNS